MPNPQLHSFVHFQLRAGENVLGDSVPSSKKQKLPVILEWRSSFIYQEGKFHEVL